MPKSRLAYTPGTNGGKAAIEAGAADECPKQDIVGLAGG
jgi:hypothetical protein